MPSIFIIFSANLKAILKENSKKTCCGVWYDCIIEQWPDLEKERVTDNHVKRKGSKTIFKLNFSKLHVTVTTAVNIHEKYQVLRNKNIQRQVGHNDNADGRQRPKISKNIQAELQGVRYIYINDYVYMDNNNLIIGLYVIKTIFLLRCLHELIKKILTS